MWLRPQGYACITSPEPGTANLDRLQTIAINEGANEYDTVACGHCNRIFHVNARTRPEDVGGMCKCCMRLICPHCVDKGCTPFERQLELMEERDRALRSYGVL